MAFYDDILFAERLCNIILENGYIGENEFNDYKTKNRLKDNRILKKSLTYTKKSSILYLA